MTETSQLQQQRVAATLFIILIGIFTAGTASVANFWLYFQNGDWQMLVMGITEAVVVIGLLFTRGLAREGHIETAGYWALGLSFVAFGAGELVHEGFTAVLAICGSMMIILIGLIFLPNRFYVWLPVLVLFGLYFLAVNRLDLLPRIDIRGLVQFRVVIMLVVVLLVGVAIWQFVSVLRFGSIRTRLLTTIVVLALIPAALIGSLATYLGVQRSIQMTQYQLGSVADLKKNQLITWIDSLVTNLQLAVPTSELLSNTELLLLGPTGTDPDAYQSAYTNEKIRYQQVIDQSGNFSEIFLVDLTGSVILSTDTSHEGRIELGYEYFELGTQRAGALPPAQYPYTNQLAVLVVSPIMNEAGEQIAILAAQADLSPLEIIMKERAGLGEQGESYLAVTKTLQLLTDTVFEEAQVGDYIYSEGIAAAGEEGQNGQEQYLNPWNNSVIGAYRALPEMGMVLLSEQPQAEAFLPVYQSTAINILLTIFTVLVAVMVALLVAGRITSPIGSLAETAEEISRGNLNLEVKVEQQDEIGTLAGAFNRMTAQLRGTLESLEDQVRERTAALAKQTGYLLASADVSRTVATVLDPDQLIHQVVELIRERFDLYYVGLFLVDARKEYAVLQAGTGAAGDAMLARQHRIQIGRGMIGWSITNRTARIAQRAELDASRLTNPELPDTRSEAAIPLISRGEVIGALTVQSTQQDIFDPGTVSVFETMAEQVAVALDNARLFVQSQQTLDSLRTVYREITLQGWRELLSDIPSMGYRSEMGSATIPEENWTPELETVYKSGQVNQGVTGDGKRARNNMEEKQLGDEYYLGIPLIVRDNVIGVLGCYKPLLRGSWTEDEISFLEEVGQTISITLESARFFTEVQTRAESERLISEVTERLRKTLDVDTVLTTAVREIQRIMDLSEVEIRMTDEVTSKDLMVEE